MAHEEETANTGSNTVTLIRNRNIAEVLEDEGGTQDKSGSVHDKQDENESVIVIYDTENRGPKYNSIRIKTFRIPGTIHAQANMTKLSSYKKKMT